MEFLFELLGEFGLQLVLEILAEFGVRSLVEPFRSESSRNPIWATFGYAIFGAVAGGLSLLIFPRHFLQSTGPQVLNLILTPIGAGLSMMLIGAWRKSRHQELIQLDRFLYGAVFALGMGLIRFWFAR